MANLRAGEGDVMYFLMAGAILFTVLVVVLLRASTREPDLGAVSHGWLARHKADRRAGDF